MSVAQFCPVFLHTNAKRGEERQEGDIKQASPQTETFRGKAGRAWVAQSPGRPGIRLCSERRNRIHDGILSRHNKATNDAKKEEKQYGHKEES